MKDSVVSLLVKKVPLSKSELESLIEIPKDSALGDFALPCFILAQKLKKSPQIITQELASKLKDDSSWRDRPPLL